jgi:hypothetical protein
MTMLCQRCILPPELVKVVPQPVELLPLVHQLIILALDDVIAAQQPASMRWQGAAYSTAVGLA